MMKHLRLYPLILAVLIAAILGCTLHIGRLFYRFHRQQPHPGAQLVREVTVHAQI